MVVPRSTKGDICTEGHTDRRIAADNGKWRRRNQGDNNECAQERARYNGVELDEIPMCSVCGDETARENMDQVLEKGLVTMTKSDGGLTRSRLDMLSELSELSDGRIGDMKLASRGRIRGPRTLRCATRTEEGVKSLSGYRSQRHVSACRSLYHASMLTGDQDE